MSERRLMPTGGAVFARPLLHYIYRKGLDLTCSVIWLAEVAIITEYVVLHY